MKKIFAILLAVVVALSMGVTSFAAVEAEVKEYVEVAVTLDGAPFVFDDEGKATSGKHYTFTVNVDNKSKENVNFKDFEVRVVFIDDESYHKDTLDIATLELPNTWINAEENKSVTAKVKKDFEGKTVDVKVSINGLAAKDTITGPTETAKVKFEKADETTTVTTTIPTTATPTEPSVETTTEAPTTVTTTLPNESETGGVDDELYPDVGDGNGYFDNTTTTKKPSNVESDIPNTGSGTAGMIAFGVLGVAALAALKMRKKKIDD